MRKEKPEVQSEDSGIQWHRGGAKTKPKTAWAVLDRVAYRYVTLLLGLPESGKSTFLAAVAAQLMGGPKLFQGGNRKPQRVMWLSHDEDYDSDILPRIKGAGGDLKKLIYPATNEMAATAQLLCFPDAEGIVVSGMKKSNVGLLVVDIATDFLCAGKNGNDYADVSAFLLSLTRIARETEAAVVLTHHAKKGHRGPAMEAALGSQAWGGRVRIGLRAFRDDKEQDKYFISTFKRGPGGAASTLEFRTEKENGVPKIASLRVSAESVEELMKKADDDGNRDAIENAKELLLDFLKDGPQHVAEVEKAGRERARVDLKTLRSAATELGVLYHKHSENGVSQWKWHAAGCQCAKCVKKRGDSTPPPPSPRKLKS